MPPVARYGLEQARNQLPAIAASAHAGTSSIITRHGKPFAAVVPLEAMRGSQAAPGILVLRGMGKGLWGPDAAKTINKLRDEWGEA